MQNLIITIIQSNLIWENTEANLLSFDIKISSLKQPTDLIILPEMFNTGFSMNIDNCAEPVEGRTFQWMKDKARQQNCVVIGSILTQEKRRFFNRLIWMKADGSYDMYDKRHLFRLANEQLYFNAGRHKLITEVKGWNICPLICYDLRFPIWSKNIFSDNSYDYDLLIYIANWPECRSYAWKSLLVARAIENQSFIIGVNRVGKDGKGLDYSGDSMLIDYNGLPIVCIPQHKESVKTFTLIYSELKNFRKRFTFGLDGDKFNIINE